jgi:hypothetical protein
LRFGSIAGNGQPRLPAQRLLDDRQYLSYKPLERIVVRTVLIMHRAEEEHSRTLGEFARRGPRFAQMADHRDIRETQVAELLRLLRIHHNDTLADMRIGEFLYNRRIEIERCPVGQRRTLRFTHRGDRLGVQHDARRSACAQCHVLNHRPDAIEIVRACDPDRVIIALPCDQEFLQILPGPVVHHFDRVGHGAVDDCEAKRTRIDWMHRDPNAE